MATKDSQAMPLTISCVNLDSLIMDLKQRIGVAPSLSMVLQYEDAQFDNECVLATSLDDLPDSCTVKLVPTGAASVNLSAFA